MKKFTREQVSAVGMKPVPRGIVIQWQDGSDLEYDFRGLRLACPCAACIDEHTGQKILRPEMVPIDVEAINIDSVGSYAIRMLWSDGHSTGIYPFELLRHIGEARLERIKEHAAK